MNTEFKVRLSEPAKSPELSARIGAVQVARPWPDHEPTSVNRTNGIRAIELSNVNGQRFKVTKVNDQDSVE